MTRLPYVIPQHTINTLLYCNLEMAQSRRGRVIRLSDVITQHNIVIVTELSYCYTYPTLTSGVIS